MEFRSAVLGLLWILEVQFWVLILKPIGNTEKLHENGLKLGPS